MTRARSRRCSRTAWCSRRSVRSRRSGPDVVDRTRFEELVSEALDSLPDWVLERMDNVEVIVEDRPPRDEEHLREVVAHTIVHEVAHHFGISDDRLREIDRY